ncbi:MAG: lysophospholipid acyltransferase family protein [Bacteroidales bacterium]
MIKARHSKFFQSLFGLYLSAAFRRHFQSMEVIGEVEDKGLPLLIIANHMSWWDGFWILELNKKLFRRRFHVMMLEEQLRQNLFLSRLGAFSIRKRSKSASTSIAYAASLLQDPANLLLIFPQGQIQSQHHHEFSFEQGWGRILNQQDEHPLQIIFVANLLDWGSKQKPILRQYIASPPAGQGFTCDDLEQQYNSFFNDCLSRQKQWLS